MEVGFDVDNGFERWGRSEFGGSKQVLPLHEKIFSPRDGHIQASLASRVSSGASNANDFVLVGGRRGKVEVGFSYEWGGKDSPKGNAHIKGEVKDKRGNYVEGEVRVHEDGKKEVKGKAGNENQDKKKREK